MRVPGIEVTDRQALKAWLDSRQHVDSCAANSEGLMCCLDHLASDDR